MKNLLLGRFLYMAAPKQKKLTLAQIKKENKKYDEMVKVTFEDNTYLHINRYFSPIKIDAMLQSFAETLQSAEKAGVFFQENKIVDFLMLHVFKHFSSLDTDIPDDLETKLIVFNELMKSNYAEKLVESYDPEQLGLVFNRIIKKLDAVGKMQELQQELRDKMITEIDKLENKEVIKEIYGIGDD